MLFQFRCEKNSLSEAAANVSKAVSERSPHASLEGILLRLKENRLELTGYDLEIGIRTYLDVESNDAGQIVVNAKLFGELIRKMPEGTVLLKVEDNYQVEISGSRTEYHISSTPAEDYPELPLENMDQHLMMTQGMLRSMILESVFSVSQDDIKPVLKGELFELINGKLNLVALDGHRLAVRSEPVKSDTNMKFVVPAKTLQEIARMLKDEDTELCNIQISSKHAIFDFSGYLVYTRLLEGAFHPYRSAIPEHSGTEVVVDVKAMISCLERASLLINEKISSPIKCVFHDGKLNVSCSTMYGMVNEDVSADIAGPDVKIGFKCKYMLDALRAVHSDRVKFMLDGSLLPMKIVPVNGDSFVYLVLPVKLKAE